MAKIFRNYTTLAEYEADTNKPGNTVCFIKDAKVIYVDGIQYSHRQLDYLPPAITEAEALEYMGKIIKNAKEVGLIYVKPSPYIYWVGPSNTISIGGTTYTADPDKINIDGLEYYQLKLDKDLDNNFYKFNGNYSIANLIFKDVDISNVTNMSNMFAECSALTSLDVSNFDTSNVTDMSGMFYRCINLTSLDLSGWNTSNVTNMTAMFNSCNNLTSLDLSNFNTNNVIDMGWMFLNCNSLTSLDFSGWNINNVTNMGWMFGGCNSLKTIRMIGCSQTTIDKIKAQLANDGITGCTIVTE